MSKYNEIVGQINAVTMTVRSLRSGVANVSTSIQRATTELSVARTELEQHQALHKALKKAKIVNIEEWAHLKVAEAQARERVHNLEDRVAEFKATGKQISDNLKEGEADLEELEKKLSEFGMVLPFKTK